MILSTFSRIGAILSVLGAVAHADANDKPVPFTASFSGSAAFTSQTSVAFDGRGLATLMGLSSNAGVAIVVGPPTAEGCIPNMNTETLTAPNGDQLVIQSNDLACPIGPTTLYGTGDWVVVGGTGRFAGAAGNGSLEGVSNFGPSLSPGTFQFTLTGSLSY